MIKVQIKDLVLGLVRGIDVQLSKDANSYKDTYFQWIETELTTNFKTSKISGGILKAWHHVPIFKEIETHIDAEMFYFLRGVAIMLFMDVNDGQPEIDSAQIVRIQHGTQLIISEGKGHFVAVAEGDEPVEMVVVAPKMDAPRITLPSPIEGINS